MYILVFRVIFRIAYREISVIMHLVLVQSSGKFMSHVAAITWRQQILNSSYPRYHDMACRAGKGYFFSSDSCSKDETKPRAIAKDLHAEREPNVTSRLPPGCIQQQSCHPPYRNLQVSNLAKAKKKKMVVLSTYICFPPKMRRCCTGGMPSFSSTRSFILETCLSCPLYQPF